MSGPLSDVQAHRIGRKTRKGTAAVYTDVAQLAAHMLWEHGAAGSNPAIRTSGRVAPCYVGGNRLPPQIMTMVAERTA